MSNGELQELKKAMVRRYDEKARRHGSQWPEPISTETRAAERSIELLAAAGPDDVVLDIGTGRRGRHLSRIARLAARSVGIDISFETVAVARSHFRREYGAGTNFGVASAEALPFGSGVFSLVVCSEVLEYYPLRYVATMLRDIRRVVRSSGRAVIDLPDSEDLRVWTLKDHEEAEGVSFFVHTLAEINDVIDACGFDVSARTKCDVEIQFALIPRR